ncbi:MAG: hypothetical protein LBH43_12795 [Treponema sp.]|jgi:hypothetical protein|nr:hypothetical protein [Treponema sp.]
MQNKPVEVQGKDSPEFNNKTTIKGITNHVVSKITDMGFNVYISFSCRRYSKSRYLGVCVGDVKYIIRISDHPLPRRKKYNFDIFTDKPRLGAVHYKTFEDMFARIVKKSLNLGKFGNNEDAKRYGRKGKNTG